MTAKHISDGRQRASRKYKELHQRLREECEPPRRAPRRTGKQNKHWAASELYRMLGDGV